MAVPLLLAMPALAGSDEGESGFAAHLGFGSLYGGEGLSLEYQAPVSQAVRLSPFVSAGSTTAIYGGDNIRRLGYALGVGAEYGRHHRLLLGASFGSQYLDYDKDPPHGYTNVNTVVGPALILGYKGTAESGLLWLVYCGASYLLNDEHSGHSGFAPVFGMGVGYKP